MCENTRPETVIAVLAEPSPSRRRQGAVAASPGRAAAVVVIGRGVPFSRAEPGLTLLPVTVPPEERYAALHQLAERGREIERRRGPDPYPRPTGPPPNLEELRRRRDEITRVAERHGTRAVRVFGSVARGEARPESDLDVLVELGERRGPVRPGCPTARLRGFARMPGARHDHRRIEARPRGDSRTDRTGGGSAVRLRETGPHGDRRRDNPFLQPGNRTGRGRREARQ